MSSSRRLAAILFADIAGYTAMMQRDEKRALQAIEKFKEEVQQKVPDLGGEIIHFYGDGCLALFQSSVDAVGCARRLQEAFRENPIVPVRIGLHSGDVMLKDGNVYGDAVNIASRIESMGVAGGVLFSNSIRRHIQNQQDLEFTSLGEQVFKNVSEPIEVFALNNDGLAVPSPDSLKGKFAEESCKVSNPFILRAALIGVLVMAIGAFGLWSISFKSEPKMDAPAAIAIFPFDVKGRADIQYLGEGMVDLISTKLDEVPGLHSIDPNRLLSKVDKGKSLNRDPEKAAQLASALGANQFVLGSIVELNGELQISASKYDAEAKKLDTRTVEGNPNEKLLASIDELVQQLISEEMDMQGEELNSLAAISTDNFESLKFYLMGEQAFRAGDHREALGLFLKSTALDSTFALAWMRVTDADAWLNDVYMAEAYGNWHKHSHRLPTKWQEYRKAYMLYVGANPKAEAAFKELIRKYGEHGSFLNGLAEYLFHFNPVYGRSSLEAKPYLEKYLELEPGQTEALMHLAHLAREYNDVAAMEEILSNVSPESESWLEFRANSLILQDTVTENELRELTDHPAFNALDLSQLILPVRDKAWDLSLLSRALEIFPSKEFELSLKVFEAFYAGKESRSFMALMDLSETTIMGVDNREMSLCLPASLMAVESYAPLEDFYEDLYQKLEGGQSSWELFAKAKYSFALGKKEAFKAHKEELKTKAFAPSAPNDYRYYYYSLLAYEAYQNKELNLALALIDSTAQHPSGYWEIQMSCVDKTFMKAEIMAKQAKYDQAISLLENIPVFWAAYITHAFVSYRLAALYEQNGDLDKALIHANIFLDLFADCDEKYRPWVEETSIRKARLLGESR